MKTILYPLVIALVGLLSCNKQKGTPEAKIENVDSIRCVQAWQQFQLPKDTILTLRYQQPIKIINGADKMTITVIDIDDFCSEESGKITYGCQVRIKLRVELNGGCSYQTKNQLAIGRYGDGREGPNTITFKDFDCSVRRSYDPISNDSTGGVLGFYNSAILFRQLLPYAKNQDELLRLYNNKENYVVTLWLKKRCF